MACAMPWMYGSKCCAPVLRTASCLVSMAGPIAVRSTQFGEGEHVIFAGDIAPETLALFLKQSSKGGECDPERGDFGGNGPAQILSSAWRHPAHCPGPCESRRWGVLYGAAWRDSRHCRRIGLWQIYPRPSRAASACPGCR